MSIECHGFAMKILSFHGLKWRVSAGYPGGYPGCFQYQT